MRGDRVRTWAEWMAEHGRREFDRLVASGRLVTRYPGLYGPPDALLDWRTEVATACRWAGAGAVVSGRAAAVLHGMDLLSRAPIELCIPRSRALRWTPPAGREPLIVHRGGIPDAEIRRLGGIRATSLAWTCLDLVDSLNPLELAVTVESAFRQKPNDLVDWLRRLVRQHSRGRAISLLSTILDDCASRAKPMRSAFEVIVWRGFPEHLPDLPPPTPGLWVTTPDRRRYEIDFAFVDEKIAVETVGWGPHGNRLKFEKDSERQADLVAMGWRYQPITWAMYDRDPAKVMGRIGHAVTSARRAKAA